MSDGAFITKVRLPGPKNHQLVSIVKPEPFDSSNSDTDNHTRNDVVTSTSQIPLLTQPAPKCLPSKYQVSPVRSSPIRYSACDDLSVSTLSTGGMPSIGGLDRGNGIPSGFPNRSQISSSARLPALAASVLTSSLAFPSYDESRSILPNSAEYACVNVLVRPSISCSSTCSSPSLASVSTHPFAYTTSKQNVFGTLGGRIPTPPSPLLRQPIPLTSANATAVAAATMLGIPLRPKPSVVLPELSATSASVCSRHPISSSVLSTAINFTTGTKVTCVQTPIYPSLFDSSHSSSNSNNTLLNHAATKTFVTPISVISAQSSPSALPTFRSSGRSVQLPLLPRPSPADVIRSSQSPSQPPASTSSSALTNLSKAITTNVEPIQSNPVTSEPPNDSANGTEQQGAGLPLWGRVFRLPDGDVHFPGLGRLFLSSPRSVLRQVLLSFSSDDGFALQLPPSAVEFEMPVESRTNNWLDQTSSFIGSRKGFHTCLCCQQTFTCQALFDSHMMRPVACLFYRCHLCRGSEAAHLTADLESRFDPRTTTASSMSIAGLPRSPYCTVLFGGVIQASNRCAIFSHFALAHPDAFAEWEIKPFLLSVCRLPESMWRTAGPSVSSLFDAEVHSRTDSVESRSTPDALTSKSHEPETNVPNLRNRKHQYSTFHQPGMELTEVWRDFEYAVTDAIPHQNISFLNPMNHSIDFGLLNTSFGTRSFPATDLHMSMPHQSSLRRLCTGSDESNWQPSLPSPDSPLGQTILHCARADLWHNHLFLTNWCQSSLAINATVDRSNPVENSPVTVDGAGANKGDGVDSGEPSVLTVDQTIPRPNRSIVAPAPQHSDLMEALNSLKTFRHLRLSTAFGSSTNIVQSLTVPTTIFETNNAQSIPVSGEPTSQYGLLRCLLCTFRTNDSHCLVEHLCGTRPSVTTKCALCSLPISIRQPNLCAVKAHLLLHLGYYIMCPECGFTPPPFLAPDAAELCLRIHLRFVCFHYNLLQVFVCTYCQGHGKAFNTITHLGLHILECHTRRTYACLWCGLTPTAQRTESSAATTATAELGTMDPVVQEPHATSSIASSETTKTRNSLENTHNLGNQFNRYFPTSSELLTHIQVVHRRHIMVPTATCTNERTVSVEPQCSSSSARSHDGLSKTHTDILPNHDLDTDSSCSEKVSESLRHLVPAVDFLCGYPCSECKMVFDRKDSFLKHIRTVHGTSHSRVSCYRCFGSCKRLLFDLNEFRQHLASCPIATQIYTATFASCKDTGSFPEHTVQFESNSSCENRLCFCFYCGIGARRVLSVTGRDSALTVDPVFTDSQPAEQTDDVGSTAVCDATVEPGPDQVGPSTSLSVDSNNKEPGYNAYYCSDLRALHTHEDHLHLVQNNNPIACPWCGHRLSCLRRTDIQQTVEHLKSHLTNHSYAVWYLNRKQQWLKNARALPHCFCGSALLDSPLAIISHSSSHLLTSIMGKFAQVTRNETINASSNNLSGIMEGNSSKETGLASGTTHRISPILRLPKPIPNAHVPCPTDIYRHLRFGIHAGLDFYLDQALLVRKPFVCPLCHIPTSTRWALCEHAFVEHWGTLCFICCLFVASTPASDQSTVTSSSGNCATNVEFQPSMDSSSLNSSSPHSSQRPISAGGSSTAQRSCSDFWDHVFQCMTKRHQLLRSASVAPTETKCDSVTRLSETLPASDTYQAIINWRLRKSNELCVAPDAGVPVDRDVSPPVVIGSSPEIADQHATPPRSGSPSGVRQPANEPLTLKLSKLAARNKRRRSCGTADCSDNTKRNNDAISTKRPYHYGKEDIDSASTSSSTATLVATDNRDYREQPTFCNTHSPCSSIISDRSDPKRAGPDELLLCVLCGAQLTADMWEDHTLVHRNPHMAWRGVPLHEPHRIVLRQRQAKVYKCHICERHFVTRFGCQRHLINRHKIPKSRIDWELLTEPYSSPHISKSTITSTSNTSGASISSSHNRTDASHDLDLDAVCLPRTSELASQASGPSVLPSSSSEHPVFYCSICHIPFLSEPTLSIHQAAAHFAVSG